MLTHIVQRVEEGTTEVCENCGDQIVYTIASTGREFHPPYWRYEWHHIDKIDHPDRCYQPIKYAAPARTDVRP